jgi:hypothetical protein
MNPKDMTDQQLNLKLARMCGYEEISEQEDMWVRKQRNDYKGKGVVVLYGDHYVIRSGGECRDWSPCTDYNAAHEVQAVALKADWVAYFTAVQELMYGEGTDFAEHFYRIIDMLNARPRHLSEAAYMTLQEVSTHET